MNFVHILLIVLVEQIYYTILTINKQLPVKKGDNFNEESVNSFINRAIDETMKRDNSVLSEDTNSPDSE